MFLAAAVARAAWLGSWVMARSRDQAAPCLAVPRAPVCGTAFLGTLTLDVPLRARWSSAQPSFDRIVQAAPVAPDPAQPFVFDVPAEAGSHRLDRAVRVGDDVFVYVTSDLLGPLDGGVLDGGFLLGSGFAYLPTGRMPSPEPRR